MSSLPPPPGLDYAFPPEPGPKRFRPTAWVAWAVILGVCLLLPALRAMNAATKATAAVPATMSAEPPVPAFDVRLELAGKFWVGGARLLQADNQSLEEVVGLPQNTAAEKITTAIVLAEFGRREEAVKLLKQANDADAALLTNWYAAVPSASTAPATLPVDRTLPADFHARYGWFADLAQSYGRPDTDPLRAATLGSAKRAATLFIALFALIGVGGAVGLVLFIVAVVLLAMGRLPFATGKPVGPAHVYVEAVAVYLGGFVAVSIAIGLLLKKAPLLVEIGGLLLVVVLASVWPLLRGVSWATQKRDWGIHTGRGIVREAVAGIAGYLAGLPVVAVGFVIMVLLMSLAKTDASHPIVQEVGGDSSWLGALSLLFIASVFAPLSEELLFRGAFVSHLRAGVGVVLAAVISGVVFAAVHPQGWVAIPALGSIGAVLAVIRQWRGSLVASVAAHAMNNTVIVGLLIFATR